MFDQDTSAYWRKRLELDQPLPPDFLEKHKASHRFLRPFFYFCVTQILFRFICPLKIYHLDRLPKDLPYIIAPNHLSSMDYVMVASAMGKRREELFPIATRLYFDKFWPRFLIGVVADAVRIDTAKDFLPALRAAAQIIKAGEAVYIQPEGYRSTDGNLLPFHLGVGVLAVETGVPLVPVYVSGALDVLPTGAILPRPHPLSVSFGEPILMGPYIEKKKTTQAYDVYKEVTDELRRRIIALQSERSAK
jgi:1-acyl-sn-glycerol-3-phosphate acyltransferase